MKIRALMLAAALLPAHAFAAEHQFKKGEAVTIQQDQAYILVRTFQTPGGLILGPTKYAPVLMRALSGEELEQAKALAAKDPRGWQDKIESNVVEPLPGRPYAEKDAEEFLFISVKPGLYVLGGVAVTGRASNSPGIVIASLCMGTVKFDAKPGVVTDLGAILVAPDDQPTAIPELSKVVSGKDMGYGLGNQVAIRPATPAMDTPDTLRALPFVPADYQALGALPNYLGAHISRVAPIPGVFDYDADGQVIDLRSASGTSP